MDLMLLLVAMALAALALWAGGVISGTRAALRTAAAAARSRGLGHYEVAYLVGGPEGVATTALGVMASSGAVLVSRVGGVQRVIDGPGIADRVERAVLDRLPAGTVTQAGSLKREVAASSEVAEIKEFLTALGLLDPGASSGHLRRWLGVLRWSSAAALATAAIELVLILLQGGLWMRTLALAIAAVVAALSGQALSSARRRGKAVADSPTRIGEGVLEDARAVCPLTSVSTSPSLAMALYGLSVLDDLDLREALAVGFSETLPWKDDTDEGNMTGPGLKGHDSGLHPAGGGGSSSNSEAGMGLADGENLSDDGEDGGDEWDIGDPWGTGDAGLGDSDASSRDGDRDSGESSGHGGGSGNGESSDHDGGSTHSNGGSSHGGGGSSSGSGSSSHESGGASSTWDHGSY
ncbi:TIGR04222 domain-containing membrane protein [Nonomuraea purpurea]|uniref:TIGR04222 domain-containing membrane protein n=1 Tax=Nonomuraea purpurea TaxID=1849276 RepID=A0ABV8G233_9ACTN